MAKRKELALKSSRMSEVPSDDLRRCRWATGTFLQPYHDKEWGVPVHDERRHFEFLVLESAQAGLELGHDPEKAPGRYREAFCDFDPDAVAELGPDDVERLLGELRIIRNRRKVESAISNARAFLEIRREFGSFDSYVWGFVDGAPVVNTWGDDGADPGRDAAFETAQQGPARTGVQLSGPGRLLRAPAGDRSRHGPPAGCFRWPVLSAGVDPRYGKEP